MEDYRVDYKTDKDEYVIYRGVSSPGKPHKIYDYGTVYLKGRGVCIGRFESYPQGARDLIKSYEDNKVGVN